MIVLGSTTQDKIIEFIEAGRPSVSIVSRRRYIEDLLLWRRYRSIALQTFGIPFSTYTDTIKYYRRVFGENGN